MTYPEPVNMTDVFDIFEYANTVSNQIFGVGSLLALYIIIAGYLKSRGTETSDCFIVAGYITAIPAVLFFIAGLINNWHLFLFIIIFVIPLAWSYFNK